jgi:hypothetical protein
VLQLGGVVEGEAPLFLSPETSRRNSGIFTFSILSNLLAFTSVNF